MMKLFRLYGRSFEGLPRKVWLLSVITFINRCGTMVLPFFAIYLTEKLGMSLSKAGFILAFYGLGSMIGAFLGGQSSDRFGPVITMFVGLVVGGAGFFVLGELRETLSLIIGLVVVSAFNDSFQPANGAILAMLTSPEQHARAFALNRLAINLGTAVGPALGGWLALYSYRILFWIEGVTCILAGVFLLFWFKGDWRFKALAEDQQQPSAAQDEPAAVSPWRHRPFMLFIATNLILACAFFLAFSILPIYYKDVHGLNESFYGAMLTLNGLIIIGLEMPLIHNTASFSKLRMTGLGAFLACAGFAMMPWGAGALYLALAVAVLTLGEMLHAPNSMALVAHWSGRTNKGRYMGVFAMSWSAAQMASPAVGGYVYEHYGPTVLWSGVGVGGVFCWLALEMLYRKEKPGI